MGDAVWAELLSAHHAAVHRELERFRGQEVDTVGDGFLATVRRPRPGNPVRTLDLGTAPPPARRDGTLQRDRIIWVVRHGDDLYVRSVNGG